MAGRYKSYPEYKDSGVGIVHSIPARWEIKPLLTICSFHSGKAHEPYIDDDGEFICVNSRFVSTGGVARKRCTRNLTPAKAGNVLMVMSDLPNGRALAKAFYVTNEQNLAVNQRVCVLSAHQNKSDTKYLYYLLDRNPLFLRHDDGVNQTHLSNALFTKFPTIFPSLPEQKQIARFLDHETGKIDSLIEKQQALIELLKEKRQAVISHAVTKGLNPDAKMKDSGVEWPKQMPSHWKRCPLKFLAKIKNGQDYKAVEAEDGFPVLGSGGRFTYASKYMYNQESVLLGRKGTIDKPLHINEPFWTVDTMYYTEISPATCGKFIYYLALTIPFGKYSTNTALPSMTQEHLGNNQFAVSSCEKEQKQIAKFLDYETGKIDLLIEKAGNAIELIQERRTALISAAVTGKIDVRDWEPAPEARSV